VIPLLFSIDTLILRKYQTHCRALIRFIDDSAVVVAVFFGPLVANSREAVGATPPLLASEFISASGLYSFHCVHLR